jgi:YVTN family beta-propeller protein/VCBS repeat-containing protein
VATGQTFSAMAATATTVNLPPVIDEPVIDSTSQATGAVNGHIVATDPENKTLTYTVVSAPAQGTLTVNKATGAFTYTPTAAQRVSAALSPEVDTVQFAANVSDGTNTVQAVVDPNVAPTPIHKLGQVDTGDGATAIAATNNRAYVTNYIDGSVTVINTLDGSVVTTIDNVGTGPSSVAVSPDGKTVYVVNSGGLFGSSGSVAVIDTASNTKVNDIAVGANPFGIAIAPNGTYAYVTNTGDATVTRITTATGVTATVKGVGDAPRYIAVSPDSKKVYVIDTANRSLAEFTATSTRGQIVERLASNPVGLAVSPDSKNVYVSQVNGTVTQIGTSYYNAIDTFSVGTRATDVQSNGDGSLLFVAKDNGTIAVVDTTNHNFLLGSLTVNAAFGTPGTTPTQLALSPDGMQIYVTDSKADVMHIVSLVPDNTNPVKGEPIVGDPNVITGVVTGNVGVTDADDDVLTYTVVSGTRNGTVVVNPNGDFTYTPTAAARHAAAVPNAPDTATTDTFIVTVEDGRRGIVTQTITLDVGTANIDPTTKFSAGTPSYYTGVVKGTVTATDKDKDPLHYSTSGTSTKGASVTVDAKGRYIYTPTEAVRHAAAVPGADQTDTFTITVDDGHGHGGTIPVTVTVKIRPKNAKPTSAAFHVNDTNTTTGAVAGTISAADADLDDFIVSGPATTTKGNITYNSANDTYVYTPTAAARAAANAPNARTSAKTDKFTVTVNDGHGGTDTVSVTVSLVTPH